MASDKATVDLILEKLSGSGEISARRMFGDYGLYSSGTLFGLVCDNRLFIKPSRGGRSIMGAEAIEASPYPGAKPCFVFPVEPGGDLSHLADLVRITLAELTKS